MSNNSHLVNIANDDQSNQANNQTLEIHQWHETLPSSYQQFALPSSSNLTDTKLETSGADKPSDGFGVKKDDNDDALMRKTIVSTLLEPFFVDQLKHDMRWRPIWTDMGHFFDVSHKIVYVSTSAIAFASATYNNKSLAFVSGSVGIFAAAMSTFSNFCFRKAREKTRSINIVLDKFDLFNIPDIVADNDAQDTTAPIVLKKSSDSKLQKST
jgi:hypothetical protein